MKAIIILINIMFASSCASAPWVPKQVAFEKQTWRICSKEIDGEEYHLKGFCYWQVETKRRVIIPDLFRRVHKVCLFSDTECLLKFQLSGKMIR